jgi:hypothetical protein
MEPMPCKVSLPRNPLTGQFPVADQIGPKGTCTCTVASSAGSPSRPRQPVTRT